MENKKMIMGIAGGVLIAAGIIIWLLSSKPVAITVGGGVKAQAPVSMKNTMIMREKDGQKLWEFQVKELQRDVKKNRAHLFGIKGKVYRKDGSYVDVVADRGEATLNKINNNFMVKGHVKFILNTGGKLYGDRFTYNEKSGVIRGFGHVRMQKDEHTAYGDYAETTMAMEKFKLKGHAKVEKGGIWNDK